MLFQLRDNVYWCNCTGRAVFLDVEADRYFCLPSDANDAFLRLAAGEMAPGDSERLQMLRMRGILLQADASVAMAPPALIEPPDHDALDEGHSSPGVYPLLRELVSEVFAVRMLRTRKFFEVVESIKGKGSNSRRPPRNQDDVVQSVAGASRAISYIMRVQDRCLVRALAVHSICTKLGIRPKLVFGVIAHPFAAHCWVQLGNKVLVGGFEHARLYTPILVLE